MIHRATQHDIQTIALLAVKLWPDNTIADLYAEFEELIADGDSAVFLCCENETAVGFAQCQLRNDYVEGTNSSPVAYLEGIFVEESYRKRGCAKALLSACEKWGKEKDCNEFASDCELDNSKSLAFHLGTGFAEVNRIICFVKKI